MESFSFIRVICMVDWQVVLNYLKIVQYSAVRSLDRSKIPVINDLLISCAL